MTKKQKVVSLFDLHCDFHSMTGHLGVDRDSGIQDPDLGQKTSRWAEFQSYKEVLRRQ